MWLPETAVDDETLEVLAEAGRQVHHPGAAPGPPRAPARRRGVGRGGRARSIPAAPTSGAARAGSASRCSSTTAPISRAIAFEGMLRQRRAAGGAAAGGLLATRATGRSSCTAPPTASPTATTAASARWRWPPRSRSSAADARSKLTNYGAFLAAHPPDRRGADPRGHLVELRPRRRALAGRLRLPRAAPTGTSAGGRRCARRSTGCAIRSIRSTRRGRGAYLATRGRRATTTCGVVLDREPATAGGVPAPAPARCRSTPPPALDARRLLELQRNRLLMYTSCGWFFDEISGIEPVQILRYAAIVHPVPARPRRRPTWSRSSSGGWRRHPATCADYGDGGEVYRRLVTPAAVDLRRVVAHYAITGLFAEYPDEAAIYAYRVERLDEARETYGGTALRVGSRPGRVDDHRRGAGGVCTRCSTSAATTSRARCAPGKAAAAYDRDEERPARPLRPLLAGRHGARHRRALPGRDVRAAATSSSTSAAASWPASSPRYSTGTRRRTVGSGRRTGSSSLPAAAPMRRSRRRWRSSPVTSSSKRSARSWPSSNSAGPLPARVEELLGEAPALGLTLDLAPVRPDAASGRWIARSPRSRRSRRPSASMPRGDWCWTRSGWVSASSLWAAQNRFFEIWRARPAARPTLAPLGVALGFALDGEVAG